MARILDAKGDYEEAKIYHDGLILVIEMRDQEPTAAKAVAAMDGRDYVLPDDVHGLARPVLAHRLLPSTDAQLSRRTPEDVVSAVLSQVPVPRPRSIA